MAKDEYDGYALRVVRLLLDGADVATIAALLTTIERTQMGYDRASDARNLPVAQKLAKLCGTTRDNGREGRS